MKTKKVIFLFIAGLCSCFAYSQTDSITIRYTELKPQIDGVISENEWINTDTVKIQRSKEWQIDVLTKYDSEYLYILFIDLVQDTSQLIAEVFIEACDNNGEKWDTNTLWFHASYSDCFESGKYFEWSNCSKTKIDWGANNLPYQNDNDNIEFRIELAKLRTYSIYTKDNCMRIAFDVGDKFDNISLWPESATIARPTTWGYANFETLDE